jgi:WD40 repeat protein
MKNVDFGILPDLIGHEDVVNGICYSPDGKTIASCSDDKTIKL